MVFLKRLLIVLAVLAVLAVVVVLSARYWYQAQIEAIESSPENHGEYFDRPPVVPDFVGNSREPCLDHNPSRKAWFGELHIHTAVSQDSSSFGNLASPKDAYAFARGEPITLHLSGDSKLREKGELDRAIPTLQLARPLDFAAVTDHAEYFGETHLCITPGSKAYDSAICKVYRGDIVLPAEDFMQPLIRMTALVMFPRTRPVKLCGPTGKDCVETANDVWLAQQRDAEEAYDRSSNCAFTSFIGYEYSLAEKGANLHRNVIFANATVPPAPLSSKDAPAPEQLWRWLKSYCVDSGTECDVLAIPHNSNWSSGRMFYPYTLTDKTETEKRELSLLRAEIEPLVEIMQVKGDSECRNGLNGVVGGPDELCDFEKLRAPDEITEDCGDGVGQGGMMLSGCMSRFSYVRTALTQGLHEQTELGVNPFKAGVIAATDNHTGAAGSVDEKNFHGSTGMDRFPERRLGKPVIVPGIAKGNTSRYNPGGLAGVWAEENSRESLFSAMKRKETFGTSGPRIKPRFFAGWDFASDACSSPTMIDDAYSTGVAMGGDMPPSPGEGSKPSFLVSALKDSAAGANNLQKLQIIKGWVGDDGQLHQQVIDIAGEEQASGTLDTGTCEPLKTGHANLCSVWRDENFNPDINAVYYARIVENPSCRWSTYDCNRYAGDERPEACTLLPDVIQERAWTSPIWYNTARD